MNLIPYIVLWSILAVAVLALALYRKLITIHGDDELLPDTAAGRLSSHIHSSLRQQR